MGQPEPSGGVTRQRRALRGPLWCYCGASIPDRRRWRGATYCSARCKDKAYNETHPVARQARLDFTPASSELAHALRGRETRAQRILARLRQGPASSQELLRVGGLRYSARVFELRRAGHRISTVEHADHAVYSLDEE